MNVYLIKCFSLRLLHDEISKLIPENANVIRMNMSDATIQDVIDECSYYSLLNEPKFVIVNDFKLNKENNVIESYFKEPNPDTTLILITDAIDKRSVIYKTINSQGHIIQIDELKDINNKINSYAKSKGVTIDYLAINKLLEYNLNNYDLALNEIDKISILTKEITLDVVTTYTARLISEENFEFCDAIIKKDYSEIEKGLADFIALKSELIPFLSLLTNQYRIIYATKCLTGINEAIAGTLGVHPYRVKLAKEKGQFYSKSELEEKLLALCNLDYQLKTTNIAPYILFKTFLVNL